MHSKPTCCRYSVGRALVLFAGCSLDGWCIGKEQAYFDQAPSPAHKPAWAWCGTLVMAYFDRAPSPAHKPVWAWGTFGFYIPISWLLVNVSSRNKGSGTLTNFVY